MTLEQRISAGTAHARGDNPLIGWVLDRDSIRYVGQDLQRPECILAEPNGTLWAADARGGVMRIGADGQQALIAQTVDPHFDLSGDQAASLLRGTLPNGLAFAPNGDILIANFGTDVLEVMSRDGRTRVLHREIDGKPMGKVNFVLSDSRGRVWITVSTRINPWSSAMRKNLADGYIALLDNGCLRVVADGLAFANEIRLDAAEKFLYVAETTRKRVSRFEVGRDGSLSGQTVHGPDSLGSGFIDGIAFDAFGNLWCTMILSERLLAITPEGDVLTLLEDSPPREALAQLEAEFQSGEAVRFETMAACTGSIAPWMASVTFGGKDLKTVYLGSLKGTRIPSFRAPVAGLPMTHWRCNGEGTV
jgi:gluconolactonase